VENPTKGLGETKNVLEKRLDRNCRWSLVLGGRRDHERDGDVIALQQKTKQTKRRRGKRKKKDEEARFKYRFAKVKSKTQKGYEVGSSGKAAEDQSNYE